MPGEPRTEVQADEPAKRPTADLILDVAFRILATEGYASLTARRVAQVAGTNLALVNYYFGGKKGLLLALFDKLERDRFERQSTLYTNAGEALSVKWRKAVAYYKQDLEDGFVRVQHELLAQGFGDAKLADRARARVLGWDELLTGAANAALRGLGIDADPRDVTLVLSAFWYGMEQLHLINVREDAMPYFDLLERIGDWLEQREQHVQQAQAGRTAQPSKAGADDPSARVGMPKQPSATATDLPGTDPGDPAEPAEPTEPTASTRSSTRSSTRPRKGEPREGP